MIQSFLHMINLTAVLPADRSLVSKVSNVPIKLFELKVLLEITFLKTSNLLLTEVSNPSKSLMLFLGNHYLQLTQKRLESMNWIFIFTNLEYWKW